MNQCTNCGAAITDDDLIIWKCPECGKKYKIKMSKICSIKKQKDKPGNAVESILKCRECGADMDNGNERLFFKCKECEAVIKGDLNHFVSRDNEYIEDDEYSLSNNLISCPDCGKKISNRAKSCPRCGCPVGKRNKKNRSKKSRKVFIILIIVLIVIVMAGGIGWYFITADSQNKKSNINENQTEILNENKVSDLQWTISYDGSEYVGIYTGEVENDIPNGEGNFSFHKDDISFVYEGFWENGSMSGNGHLNTNSYLMHFSEFDRIGNYSGTTINGIPEGQGVFSAVNSEGVQYKYTGAFRNGLYNGQGSQIWEDEYAIKEIGNFTDGRFCPSIIEGLNAFGSIPSFPFTVKPETATVIEANMQYIMGSDFTLEDVQHMINFDLSYIEYIKRPDEYLGQFVCWTGYTATQVWANTFFDTENEFIEINAVDDSGHCIYAFAFDEGKSELANYISEGTNLDFVGIPLGTSYFTNTDGGSTNCVVLLISFVGHY